MTAFNSSLTNLTALHPQSHDCSCYLSWRKQPFPMLWLQKNTIYAHNIFALSRLVTSAEARLCYLRQKLETLWY